MDLASYKAREKLSLSALAARLGRPPSTVHGWLSGARRPDWAGLEAIVAATEGAVTPNDFLPLAARTRIAAADGAAPSPGRHGFAENQTRFFPIAAGASLVRRPGLAEAEAPAKTADAAAMLEAARALGVDVEAVCARALREAISAEKTRRWRQENRDAVESHNAWVAAHGIPLAKYRPY